MKRLTDEQLHILVRFGDSDKQDMASEILELRALLATPMPKHMLCPNSDPPWSDGRAFVTAPGSDGRVGIATRWIADDLLPEDATALGASLIRAALEAKEGK